MIDEVSPSDSDYIFTSVQGGTSPAIVALSDPTDPVSSSSHVVRWRELVSNRVDDPITLEILLLQGATTIATGRSGTITVSSATAGSYTLSGAEADNITDYSDLRLKFTAGGFVDDGGVTVIVTWAELEVPDVAASGIEILRRRIEGGR